MPAYTFFAVLSYLLMCLAHERMAKDFKIVQALGYAVVAAIPLVNILAGIAAVVVMVWFQQSEEDAQEMRCGFSGRHK